MVENEFVKLENALMRAGRAMEYPATPPIAARVRGELTRDALPRAVVPTRNWARILIPLAAAIVLALALLFAIPNARDAVAQFLGMRGLRIFYATPTHTPSPPTPLPTNEGGESSPSPSGGGARGEGTATLRATATPTIKPFTLCCETTLADAQKRARFRLLAPRGEMPSKVYYQRIFTEGEQVVMVFGDPENPRFTLYQAQRWIYGKMVGELYGKGVSSQTVIGETFFNGHRALWFSGAPHIVMMLDASGKPIYETQRNVDANTLAWEIGDSDLGIIYRLETKLSLHDATRFAESLEEYKP